jgi:hypothetical protein
MIDTRLLSYIQQQLQHGYDIAAIRTALLQGGYPQQAVDETIQYITHGQQAQPIHPQQTSQPTFSSQQKEQLSNYCKQYLAQGYSVQQIQQFLLQNRYPPALIEEVLAVSQKKPFQFPKPSGKTVMILFLVLFILGIIGAITWFFMNMGVEQTKEVDFDVSLDIDTVAPGETLYINNDFINFPEKRETSIQLYYTINEKETLTRVDSWQLSMGISDALIKSTKRTVLKTLDPGEYELNVKMNYASTSKQIYEYFTVSVDKEELQKAQEDAEQQEIVTEEEKEEEPTEQEISEQETETATEEETEEIVETTYETNVIGEDDYVNLAAAKELAETDSAAAAQYCELIQSLSKTDECYAAVARLSNDKSYCEEVVSDISRDACWMGFALNYGDYTVCENVENPYLKSNCKSQQKIAELQAQYGG